MLRAANTLRAGLPSMLHTYQPAPFSEPARQHQFEAIAAALAADAQAPETILLGNISLETPAAGLIELDAVIVRPRSITLLLLVSGGGLLQIPDFRVSAWRLHDAPLTGSNGTDNPFQQFQLQRDALAEWLQPLLPADAANLHFIGGLVLFAEPVRFGPEVEERMSAVPAASTFHLLPDPARFTRRLAQLATPEIDLTPTDLQQLAAHIGLPEPPDAPAAVPAFTPPAAAPTTPYQPGTTDMLRQKAGQLWRWLGAEDLNELDRTDSGYEVDIVAVRSQEKAQLEQMRASLQADLNTQLQALESREAEREQSIAQLRAQLSAATPAAPEAATLASQLAAESEEKATIEATMQAYQQQSAARTQELEQKIQQLEALIGQLKPTPAAPGATPAPTAAAPTAPKPSAAPKPPTAPPTPPPSGPRPQFGRPAEAANDLLAQVRRWRPRLRQLRHQVQRHPKRSLAAAGAAVLLLGWWGLHTSTGNPPATFRQGNRWGLISTGGDTLAPAQYASIGEFINGRAVVERDGAMGFVDEQGKEVIKPAYDALYPYAEGFARARIGRLYTFLDEKGEEFPAYYYSARDFAEGHAAVLDYRGWYYLTGPDEPSTPPATFQEAYSFSKGLARVKTKGSFTFITQDYLADTTKGFSPFSRYTNAADFDEHDRARVTQAGRTFFINREGEEVKE